MHYKSKEIFTKIRRNVVLFASHGIIFLFTISCSPSNQSSDIRPTTPKPTETVSTYDSGGLGIDRIFWESSHGTGKPDNLSSPMFFSYEGGKFQVQFSKLKSGNVSYIERVWGDTNAIPLTEARKEGKLFIPADSKFVKTYISANGSTIDLYSSDSLKTRFTDEQFIGGKAGNFIILYRNQTKQTTTFIISLGNNP